MGSYVLVTYGRAESERKVGRKESNGREGKIQITFK